MSLIVNGLGSKEVVLGRMANVSVRMGESTLKLAVAAGHQLSQ